MNQATIDFIREHAEDDVRRLALKGAADPEVDMKYALEQIAGWQAARRKLPSWATVEGLEYPPHLSMEQCSGERAARYKAEVAARLMGNDGRDGVAQGLLGCGGRRLVDLTGGFGVDFSFMARAFDEAVYVERQERLCDIARRNMPLLGLEEAGVVCGEAENYLKGMPDVVRKDGEDIFDGGDVALKDAERMSDGDGDARFSPIPSTMIFLDPARRDDAGGRTFAISDCTPDVVKLRDELLRKADYVMVKLSPMLDWRKAVADMGDCVGEVHIVAVDNECKDLLLVMSACYHGLERLYCINNEEKTVFDFASTDSTNNLVPSAECTNNFVSSAECANLLVPSDFFLFEPNVSVMKSGLFDALSARYGINQVERNSHLFVSETDRPDFPGRRFVVEKRLTMNKRELKAGLAGITKANVAVRNFPLSVAELRKRLKLADGGDTYIFASTERDGSHVLYVCRKV